MNLDLLEKTKPKIIVIGDIMLDCYINGDAERISPEAPVPVVFVRDKEYRLGGAANTAANVAALGCECYLVGLVGTDQEALILREALRDANVYTSIVAEPSRPTTVKTRVTAGGQQIVRFDQEDSSPLNASFGYDFEGRARQIMDDISPDAIIFEDYAKGVLPTYVVNNIVKQCYIVQETTGKKIITALDPCSRRLIQPLDLDILTPNKKEALAIGQQAQLFYFKKDTDKQHLSPSLNFFKELGKEIVKAYRHQNLLITMGADGILLCSKDSEPVHIPTQATDVFDVSGAGDTVIAAFTAMYAAGEKDPVSCAMFANYAAGIAVGKRGTSVVTLAEIKESIG